MSTHSVSHSDGAFTRRQFLATGLTAASTMTVCWGASAAPVPAGSASSGVEAVDPGYVGPLFYDQRESEAVQEVITSGSPFRYWGPGNPNKVRAFEEAFARAMEVPYALGVTSGTAALDCAVTGLGIGPGDEVIVPAYTWWSDYTCVVHAGALPVFAEIDRTFNLDPADFERRITPRTKAVIAVHLLGGQCDMDPILEVARRRGVAVLEDCAQCVGGSWKGERLGGVGDVGIYSFQINKMITSGEGGALVTRDPKIYERAARFHDMGSIRGLFEERLGGVQCKTFAGENFRMNELTGAVLGAQLPKLETMIARMRANADQVRSGIESLPGIRMRRRPDPQGDIGYAVFFETGDQAERDRCIRALRQKGIPASPLSGSVFLPAQESVINKRTRHADWPSFKTEAGRSIRYGSETCPQTAEILDRFVQIRIGPKYTSAENTHLVDGIRAVYHEFVR